ncbi:MAG: hypothetical protein EOO02_04725 [Chitinophagaceae bacterium]|nr:MAG: hypothetical protein EOO02_04725 [Chitinophagaceae bacterium]
MKKWRSFLIMQLCIFVISVQQTMAQCSICTRTAQQLGEGPGKALNGGIIYLAAAPLAILGFIGYKWYKSNSSAS